MKRREFCQTSLVFAAGTAMPWLAGCGPKPKTAAEADTSIRAISLDGKEFDLQAAAVKELGEAMTGQVILSGDPAYDGARHIWNGMHDKRPAVIARCMSAEDVRQAVTFARDNNLLLAVRGGGHSWPGKSVCDGGLMLDLSQMYAATVDPEAKLARIQGGALLHGLDEATLEHGLVTTAGVVSHTGVGGFTLGGGYGNLNRKYGLAIDNLESAQIVTADGQIRRVSADENPDLFWAIRGGGGNFGVVTEFEYRLHPFDRNILAGDIVWPLDQAHDVLAFYAEWSAKLSDEMYVGPTLATPPDGAPSLILDVIYNGDPAKGEKELAPLKKIGKPVADGVTMQDYVATQTKMDSMLHHGIRSYAKSGMVKEWSQGLVDAVVGAADPHVFLTSHVAGGAVKRVGELDTAYPHRNAEIMFVIASAWEDPTKDDEFIAATRQTYGALEPFMGGYYDNIDFDRSKAGGNYGPAYERLSKIKGQYDRGNLFRLNSNIEPSV